jgi:hypothetical protein
MTLPADVAVIAGAQELYDWFGYWPDFHDAEVLNFHLELGAPSRLVIHPWEMTNRVNAAGSYELIKHVVVEFVLSDVTTLNLQDPWEHSLLFGLEINRSESGFRLDLSATYGLSGTLDAKDVSLHVTPGKPGNTIASS